VNDDRRSAEATFALADAWESREVQRLVNENVERVLKSIEVARNIRGWRTGYIGV
jgi:hypothetical protein